MLLWVQAAKELRVPARVRRRRLETFHQCFSSTSARGLFGAGFGFSALREVLAWV